MISVTLLLGPSPGNASPLAVQGVFIGFLAAFFVGAGLAWILNKMSGREVASLPMGAGIAICAVFLLQVLRLAGLYLNGGITEDQLMSAVGAVVAGAALPVLAVVGWSRRAAK
jgi:hypothetical protein